MAYVFLPSIDKHMYSDVDDEESKDFFSRFESGRLMPGFFLLRKVIFRIMIWKRLLPII